MTFKKGMALVLWTSNADCFQDSVGMQNWLLMEIIMHTSWLHGLKKLLGWYVCLFLRNTSNVRRWRIDKSWLYGPLHWSVQYERHNIFHIQRFVGTKLFSSLPLSGSITRVGWFGTRFMWRDDNEWLCPEDAGGVCCQSSRQTGMLSYKHSISY